MKVKIKFFFLKAIFFCLLFLGLFLTFSPWIKEALIKQEMTRYCLTNFTVEEIQSNIKQVTGSSEMEDITEPDFTTVLTNISKVDSKNVVGAIAINDLGILLPILEGTNTENLLVGATTVNDRQVLGERNYVLAGHHMSDESLLFGSLHNIKAGTWIQLTDLETVYTYEVMETKIVHETDLSVLDPTDVPTVTLITCNTATGRDSRRIVIGQLIDTSNLNDNSTDPENGADDNEYTAKYNYQVSVEKTEGSQYIFYYWIIGIVLLSLLLLMLLILVSKRIE